MLLIRRTLLLSTATVLALAAAFTPHTARSGDNPQSRPFQAVGVAVWDNILAGFVPELGASFQGTGVGTHLGNFGQAGDLFFSGPPDDFGVIPGFGSVVLTAANGDELHFDYEGVLDSVTGIGSGSLTFTGGTGRFANASGDGSFYAEIDLSAGPANAPMTVWLKGRVAY